MPSRYYEEEKKKKGTGLFFGGFFWKHEKRKSFFLRWPLVGGSDKNSRPLNSYSYVSQLAKLAVQLAVRTGSSKIFQKTSGVWVLALVSMLTSAT